MPPDLDPVAVLARTDPATAWPVPPAPPLVDLADLPVASTGHRRRARTVVLAAAAVLVALVVGAALVLAATGDDGSTPPATEPDPRTTVVPGPGPAPLPLTERGPAREHLLALADRIEDLDPDLGPGTVAYSRSVGFVQETTRPGDPASLIAETTHLETWTGADFVVRVEQGRMPPFTAGEVVQIDPDPTPTDVEVRDQARFDTIARDLPDDPEQLAGMLGFSSTRDPGATDLLQVGVALGEEPRTGADRASVYRVLAEVEGVEYRGPVVDRAGRDGFALSLRSDLDGEVDEAILVVDPATGVVLGREDLSLASDPTLPFDGPTVQFSWTHLGAAYVAAPGDRPA